ncbi:MAG: formylglycine-generating enzyme family protein [Bacteroidales bacterium]|nr:formylglycine-generating enzyme family protein [Bacteroidales bacterium]
MLLKRLALLAGAAMLTVLLAGCGEEGDKPAKPTGGGRGTTHHEPAETELMDGPRQDTTIEAGGYAFTMRYIPAGSFQMGANAEVDPDADLAVEGPQHTVSLSGYLLADMEVLQGLFMAMLGYNPAMTIDPLLPVNAVSHEAATKFIEELGRQTGLRFRLPTEAEWEYAARGANNDTAKAYLYSGGNDLNQIAWHAGNAGNSLHYGGSKQPNSLGLYDMTGNVAEWCSDWYGPYDKASQSNPQGSEMPAAVENQKRVVRGGSFKDAPYYLRNTHRAAQYPKYEGKDVGIRVALSCR